MADNKVKYYVRIDDKYVEADMQSAEGKVASAGGKIGNILKGTALAVGAAMATATVSAVKFGSEFETSMAMTSTLIDTSVVDMDKLESRILELSNKTGVAAADLGDTMYNALSAGVELGKDGADMMDFLERNAKLAKAGKTDIDTAVTSTAKVLNAYKMSVEDTDRVHKILMQTQNEGITTVGELGASLAQVTPTAAAMGVEFEQVGAALATMTVQGTPTAQATTQLNSLFAELGKQGTQASKILEKQTGKSFKQLMSEGYSLSDVLSLMQVNLSNDAKAISQLMSTADKATGKTMTFEEACAKLGLSSDALDGELINMFGSIEAGKAALAMTGQNAEQFNANLAAMSTEADVVGEAFEKATDTSAEKFNKMMNQLKNMSIELFASLEPLISAALPAISQLFSSLGPTLKNLTTGALKPFIDGIISFIPQLSSLVGTFLPALAKGFGLAMAPIGILAESLLPLLVEAFDLLAPIFDDLISIAAPLLDVFRAIIEPLAEMAGDLLPLIADAAASLIEPLQSMVEAIMPSIMDFITAFMPLIETILSDVLPPLIEIFTAIQSLFYSFIGEILPPIIDLFTSLLVPLTALIESILPPILDLFNSLIPIISGIMDTLRPLIEIFSQLITLIVTTLSPVISSLAALISGVLAGSLGGIMTTIGNVLSVFGNLIDFIKNVFTGNWSAAWENVKNIFSSICDAIGNIFKAPINFIIDGINGFLNGLNGIKIPDWVPVVGGMGFSIPLIPRLKQGIDFVPSDFYPAYLDLGERVLTKEENEAFNTLGGVRGMEIALSGNAPGANPQNVTVHNDMTATVEMDGYEVGRIVLRNIDDVKDFS